MNMRHGDELRTSGLFHEILATKTPSYLYGKITSRTNVRNTTTHPTITAAT